LKISPILFAIYAFLIIGTGAIFASLPIVFWDFLVTYQFRPTVRPFYSLFYGSIFGTGIVIILFGIYGLIKLQSPKALKIQPKWVVFVFGGLCLILGPVLLGLLSNLYFTTEYLSADMLYHLIVTGLVLGIVAAIVLLIAGCCSIYFYIKNMPAHPLIRLGTTIPLVLLIAGGMVAGVLMLPPAAECLPFPEDIPYRITLYNQGDAGYHTFKIPTMITAANGTILAFAEARVSNQEDWGKMDMVVRKSYDGGDTWTPLEVLVTEGDLTIGNTVPVVDRTTGYIWILFCKENNRCFKMNSQDNGETWSDPVDITSDVKLDGWTWYAFGPTHGIQLQDGTLVIPADHIVDRKMTAHIVYSKDHGATWQLGGSIPGGEEATIVELNNGDLYINIRPVRPGYRLTAISKDQGLTWTNIKFDYNLPDPACQGNMIQIDDPASPGTRIFLFSNAADSLHREKMTVRVSYDDCNTWMKSKVLFPGLASYSDMSLINETNTMIGCLFEKGCNFYAEEIVFTRFPLSYIFS
jgi:sialidase-1